MTPDLLKLADDLERYASNHMSSAAKYARESAAALREAQAEIAQPPRRTGNGKLARQAARVRA
jgi:hypothetical protein